MHPDDLKPSQGNQFGTESDGHHQRRLSVDKMSENGLEDFSDINNSDAGTVPTVAGAIIVPASLNQNKARSPRNQTTYIKKHEFDSMLAGDRDSKTGRQNGKFPQ